MNGVGITVTKRVLAGFVATMVLVSACSKGEPPKDAAVVEGVKIASSETEALIDAYLHRRKAGPKQEELPRDQVGKLVLEYQIKLTLLDHLASKMGVSIESASHFETAADLIQPGGFSLLGQRREDFVRELRAGRLSKMMAAKLYSDVSVAEETVRQEYERLGPRLDRNWKARARVALFGAKEQAEQVRGRVGNGEPFEQTASTLGAQDVATVDLNPVVAPLPPAALEVVANLRAGEVSDAIPTTGGWLAVLVEDHRDLPRLSLEDLRPELTDLVAERRRFELFQEWFAKQFAEAKITVAGHYGKWDPRYTKVT